MSSTKETITKGKNSIFFLLKRTTEKIVDAISIVAMLNISNVLVNKIKKKTEAEINIDERSLFLIMILACSSSNTSLIKSR